MEFFKVLQKFIILLSVFQFFHGILAIAALALVWIAQNSNLKAFAVFSLAIALFAFAAINMVWVNISLSGGHLLTALLYNIWCLLCFISFLECTYTLLFEQVGWAFIMYFRFECLRISHLDTLSGLFNIICFIWNIGTVLAIAWIVTKSPNGKTFAIHFQALCFLAFTRNLIVRWCLLSYYIQTYRGKSRQCLLSWSTCPSFARRFWWVHIFQLTITLAWNIKNGILLFLQSLLFLIGHFLFQFRISFPWLLFTFLPCISKSVFIELPCVFLHATSTMLLWIIWHIGIVCLVIGSLLLIILGWAKVTTVTNIRRCIIKLRSRIHLVIIRRCWAQNILILWYSSRWPLTDWMRQWFWPTSQFWFIFGLFIAPLQIFHLLLISNSLHAA